MPFGRDFDFICAGHGSERTVTNASQSVTGTLNLDAFGNQAGSTGSSTDPYEYAATSGYRTDGDAGLALVGARYYDAQVGRFVSRDTDLSQKPYCYCEGDPVNALDPSGHFAVTRGEIFAGVIGLVGGAVTVAAIGLGAPVVATAIGVGIVFGALGGAGGADLDGKNPIVGGVIGGVAGAFQGVGRAGGYFVGKAVQAAWEHSLDGLIDGA